MNAEADEAASSLQERPALTGRQRAGLRLLVPPLIAAVCALATCAGWFDGQELLRIDARFRHRGPLPPDPRIVVVQIDEKSRRELGAGEQRFDLRAHLDEAIDRLADAGAIVIGVDVWLAGRGDQATDARLAEAISNANVVLASAYVESRNVRPADVFLDAQAIEGLISVDPDPDGVLRRIPRHPNLGMASIEGVDLPQVPHFPFVLAWMALSEEELAAGRQPEPADFTASDHAVLMGRTVRYGELVNFVGGPRHGFATMSFADAVTGRFEPQPVDGAVVLIGDARSIVDQFRMAPSDRLWPGVYYHANVVNQILQDCPLSQWPAGRWGTAALVAAITAVAGWYFWNLQAWWVRPRGWLLLALYFAVGTVLFIGGWRLACHRAFAARLVLPMVAPWVGIAAVMLTGLAAQAAVTIVSARRLVLRNRWIESLFGRSVSRQVLQAIKDDPQRIAQIELREVSVLFCDIRGFTATATGLSPQEVARMLNEYFEAITSAVFENDGFVDKFVGDELMVVFNVPLDQPDHAVRAARTGLGIKRRLAELNTKRTARGEPPLDCGVGIHCGPVAAGHIGTAQRASYTVVGDTVNMAARIEGLTGGGEILISEQLERCLDGALPTRPWKTVQLRGSDRQHRLFELPPNEGP